MKALDYAIRTKNWELAALCLVVGAMEALKEMPADSIEEMMAILDADADAQTGGRSAECAPRRQARVGGKRRGG